MRNLVLYTDRLLLRKMIQADVEVLMEIFSDSEAMKYYPSTKNEQQASEWVDWTLRNYDTYGTGLWIVEDKAKGDFLGQCGIVPQQLDDVIEMEIGYLFARRVWGNGYATEAALACKKYGFEQMGLRKLISFVDVNNTPSARVAERIGMTVEKTINKWEKDVLVYAVSL
ncbi:GNAT family N-acetyltransferase [Paenibacillus assamensis]|uniref:GNAT family N-acetyltransferase n=1 Tax=Paenibacillus assamensis TaxID=311244 RepID=UPI000412BEF7|nr:GNAT family N-acetyltransferase [Paenibacillus assamensis]